MTPGGPRLFALDGLCLGLGLGLGLGCVAVQDPAAESELAPIPAATATEPAGEGGVTEGHAEAGEPGPSAASPMLPFVAPPEPPPRPAVFVGRETVRVDELLAAVAAEVPHVAASEAVAADYAELLAQFELADDPELYLDYVRIKIAFEATRAGGWWGLRWDITNQQPDSTQIWAAWHALGSSEPVPATVDELAPVPRTTVTAECDELSALFAFVVHRIGLSKRSEVGLLWPTGNHVVAVWTLDRKSERPTRIVVPTSQIFLDGDQSLATDGFDPWRQNKIFDYRRQDAAVELTIPAALASGFVEAIHEHGPRSQASLQADRNAREAAQADDG